jgi:hypothetical protein
MTEEIKSLQELRVFSKEELEKLKNDLPIKLSDAELEATIQSHGVMRRYFWALYGLANLSSFLHMVFQINTSNEGIESSIKALVPGADIPDWFSKGLEITTITTALLSTLLYTLIFSAHNEAIKSTVKYSYSKERALRLYHEAGASPGPFLKKSTIFITHATILAISNITGSMSNLIDILAKINTLPTPLNWFIIIIIIGLAEIYYEKYMDDAYFDGLQFWSDKTTPFLWQELRAGNVSLPFQIILQALSTIGVRTFFFYYLAEASSKALGFWLPPPLVAAIIILHSLCVLYPGVYHRYLDAKIKNHELPAEALAGYRKQILQEQGHFFLFKNAPIMVLPFLFRALAGGWLGWKAGGLMSDSIILAVFLAIVMGLLLAVLLYLAESKRIMHELIDSKHNPTEEAPKSFCELAADKGAYILNIADCFSTTASLMGVGVRELSYASLVVPLCVMERGFGLLHHNERLAKKTVQTELVPERCKSVRVDTNRFFRPSNQLSSEEQLTIEEEPLNNPNPNLAV